jgi:probable phosphoglycerate mutase
MNDESKIVAYFVRHGSTALNDQDRFRGPLDPPLDEHGLKDADDAKNFLSGVELSHAFSSDRDRTETTARSVLEPKGMTYKTDPNFRAWNVGFLGGQPKKGNEDAIDYFARHPDTAIPRGESLNQFRERVRPSIYHSIQTGVAEGKPTITFSHSSVLKEVSNVIHGDHLKENVDPGGILGVYYDGKNYETKALLKKDTSMVDSYPGGNHGYSA